MKLETIIKGTPVTLPELLNAREARAFRQKELLTFGVNAFSNKSESYSLISFSMNFADEIKSFPLGLAAFDEGLKELHTCIPKKHILHFEESRNNTGPEAFFLLAMDADIVKTLTTSIEESHPLGRLFDIDVLRTDGTSVSRSSLGLPPRTCLICGENAKVCSRSRNHTLEIILWRTAQMLNDFFKGNAADTAAACAVRALLYEVSATPKPGLVDRNNSGSHKDMDFFTFLDSSAALIPWFRDFFCIGWDHCNETEDKLFSRLRFAGQKAEARMFAATNQINTHKGLIFAFAVILGALGKAYAVQNSLDTSQNTAVSSSAAINQGVTAKTLLSLCSQIAKYSLSDFEREQKTAGEHIQKTYGISGARGEAAAGFPSSLTYGLPALKHGLKLGFSLNDAASLALISIISKVDDTNMIHRGGLNLALQSKKEAGALLSEITPDNFTELLTALDVSYIQKNLSPGGCADLLAISLLFLFLEEHHMCIFP